MTLLLSEQIALVRSEKLRHLGLAFGACRRGEIEQALEWRAVEHTLKSLRSRRIARVPQHLRWVATG